MKKKDRKAATSLEKRGRREERKGYREGRREEGRHVEFCFCCAASSFRRATIS